jgi:hypothetical protein
MKFLGLTPLGNLDVDEGVRATLAGGAASKAPVAAVMALRNPRRLSSRLDSLMALLIRVLILEFT